METDAVHTSADSLITGRLDQQGEWAAHGAAPRQSYGARRPELQGASSFGTESSPATHVRFLAICDADDRALSRPANEKAFAAFRGRPALR